jgi:hypothetical protein
MLPRRDRLKARQRRLRIFNTLLWALKVESFILEGLSDKNIVVGHGRHRTKFSILEGTDRPQRATSDSWRKPNGHLSCQIGRTGPSFGNENTQHPGQLRGVGCRAQSSRNVVALVVGERRFSECGIIADRNKSQGASASMDQILPNANPNGNADLRGVEDTFGNMANGNLPVAEVLRRAAEHQKVIRQNLVNDPIGTLMPMSRPIGAMLKAIPSYVASGLGVATPICLRAPLLIHRHPCRTASKAATSTLPTCWRTRPSPAMSRAAKDTG